MDCHASHFRALFFAVAAGGSLLATNVLAQSPKNYGAYFSQNAGMRGVESSGLYLYDKYFYHNTAVSPYVNLARPGYQSGVNYYLSVRPELERREATEKAGMAYVQQRKLQGNVGHTALPGAGFLGGTINDAILKPAAPKPAAKPSSYYNHWYGGWSNR